MPSYIIATDTLITKNINDFYTSERKGFGFSISTGINPDKSETNKAPKGSTTIGLKSTGSEKEQDTKATIGNGSIVIAGKEVNAENGNTDLIRDLNRNKDNSKEITKDMITGVLDGSMTVDNRLFTKEGRESIVSDFKNFGGNLLQATENLVDMVKTGAELTKEQYNNLKEYFKKQEEEIKVVVGYYKEALLAAPPNSPEYFEMTQAYSKAQQMLTTSQQGLDLLIKLEGLETEPYKDTAGIDTIGVGHVIKKNEQHLKNGITEIDAIIIFLEDIQKFEKGVNKQIMGNLSQNQFDALVSLTFNIGLGNPKSNKGFYNSTIKKMLNDDDYKSNTYPTEEEAWKAFNKSGGKVDKGLKNRRTTEYNLFINNEYKIIRSK